jgi:hypothetical protein
MEIRQIERDDRLAGSYVSTIKVALFGLLFGGSFLALAQFYSWSNSSETRRLVLVAEILGWVGYIVSSSTLLGKWIGLRDRERRFGFEDWGRARGRASLLHTPIDKLYAELRSLMSHAATDPSLTQEVRAKLSTLRQLQSEEADEMEKRFEAGLLLQPGEGHRALERARELLDRYENPPPPDATTLKKN